jgi:hypothetical protein
MTMVQVQAGSVACPQGVFYPTQYVNLPAADAAHCIALGVCTAAPGVLPSPSTPWWARTEMNLPVFPNGTVTFSGQPTTGSSIVLQGTTVGFVTSGATGNQVNIGANLAATLTALATFLNASVDANISQAVYSASATVLNVFSQGVPFAITASTSPASNVSTVVNAGP